MTEEKEEGFEKDDGLVEGLISSDFGHMMEKWMSMNPFLQMMGGGGIDFFSLWQEENERLWSEWGELCEHYGRRLQGEDVKGEDFAKKFSGEAWDESLMHDMLRRFYVIMSKWWHDAAVKMWESDEDLSDGDRKRLEFQLGLFLGAISPSNFAVTNPEVVEATLSTRGQNLVKGMENFMKDVKANKGHWKVATVEEGAFELGENLAMTRGEVIYKTTLFELIQYYPTKKSVMREPLLVVPPVINKYYVMDLQEKNSFVRWCVEEGVGVFMISWINPSAALREQGFSDYVMAIEEALEVVKKESGEKRIHTLGYCVGGTMLSGYLARRAKLLGEGEADEEIASATLLTCLVDFSDVGDISIFLNEEQMASINLDMKEKGYFDAYVMASSFSLLRADDLIWSFVVNNYLLGKDPSRFDLLYWNNDSTNLTESFFREYMEVAYIGNSLCKRDEAEIGGVLVDVGRVRVSMCFVASEEDHIAPWKSCFASAGLFSGDKTFILGGSGHVNGMINPPKREKYFYRGGKLEGGVRDELWKGNVDEVKGSWWGYWRDWLGEHSEGEVKARRVCRRHKSLGKAPGTYILTRV